jgi:hypothetical protein
MTEYTLFCFVGPTLAHGEKFFAANDEAAIKSVMASLDGQAAELWAGPRKVSEFLDKATIYPVAPEQLRPSQ